MVYLQDVVDMDALAEHINNEYINVRSHPTLPLLILNYADKCQYDNMWDETTMACRGLIYNSQTLEVVARPFPKFFNWDQGRGYPPVGPCLRMEKMDGSLGILYWDESDPNESKACIATRGSFESNQAKWATDHIRNYFPGEFEPRADKTYLFEIIYPANRIVVDYGEYEGLVLLDVIDNETGHSDTQEFNDCVWPEKVARHPLPGFDSGQVVDIPKGEEGFVYLWPTRNYRTKMKSAEYLEIHKLVTGLNEKVIWKAMMDGKSLDDILDGIPDEFHDWVREVYAGLEYEALSVLTEVEFGFAQILEELGVDIDGPIEVDRKEFALLATKREFGPYLFARLDGRDVYMLALRSARPKVEPFKIEV